MKGCELPQRFGVNIRGKDTNCHFDILYESKFKLKHLKSTFNSENTIPSYDMLNLTKMKLLDSSSDTSDEKLEKKGL